MHLWVHLWGLHTSGCTCRDCAPLGVPVLVALLWVPPERCTPGTSTTTSTTPIPPWRADRLALTPVALMEAMALTATLFGGAPTAPDHANIATAVFSHPQIGTVGLSEEQVGGGVRGG